MRVFSQKYFTRFPVRLALAIGLTVPLGFAAAHVKQHAPSSPTSPAAPAHADVLTIYPVLSGRARVVDGDTLDVDGVRVRLEGIDAPEKAQRCARRGGGTWRCGRAATRALRRLVAGRTVRCADLGRGRYGRMLGLCHVGALEVNGEMVRRGLAWAFVKYSRRYKALEEAIRSSGRGIWQAPTQTAWDFRAGRWRSAEPAAPGGCAIKGNISRNGKIYHMPWSPWYNRVRIDPFKGERWFCSENDAKAAGWRPVGAG